MRHLAQNEDTMKRKRAHKPGTVIKIRVSDQALAYIKIVQAQQSIKTLSAAGGTIIDAAAQARLLIDRAA